MKNETEIFTLILHGGNGRSAAMEAIYAAKAGDLAVAQAKIEEAKADLNEAHHLQTALIGQEINGEPIDMSLLMVHAQDHLMTAIVVKDLATELIDVYARLQKLEADAPS